MVLPAHDSLHVVKVGLKGKFLASGQVHTGPAEVDRIFQHLKASKAQKLTLHFHGGLTDESTGLATAERMRALYSGVSHPVTLVWETGLFETF